MRNHAPNFRHYVSGAAVIEFALIASLFFMLMIGIVELARVMFYWNTATELTRMGARIAAVCDIDAGVVADKVSGFYPLIPRDKVLLSYSPQGCNLNTCAEVTVSVASGVAINTMIPFLPLNLSLPEFKTTLPRESLQSTFGGVANPVCS